MQKVKHLIERLERLGRAFLEALVGLVCLWTLDLYIKDLWKAQMIPNWKGWIFIGFLFGVLLLAITCRALSFIDHGWKGLFTTYKSENDVPVG